MGVVITDKRAVQGPLPAAGSRRKAGRGARGAMQPQQESGLPQGGIRVRAAPFMPRVGEWLILIGIGNEQDILHLFFQDTRGIVWVVQVLCGYRAGERVQIF